MPDRPDGVYLIKDGDYIPLPGVTYAGASNLLRLLFGMAEIPADYGLEEWAAGLPVVIGEAFEGSSDAIEKLLGVDPAVLRAGWKR